MSKQTQPTQAEIQKLRQIARLARGVLDASGFASDEEDFELDVVLLGQLKDALDEMGELER